MQPVLEREHGFRFPTAAGAGVDEVLLTLEGRFVCERESKYYRAALGGEERFSHTRLF